MRFKAAIVLAAGVLLAPDPAGALPLEWNIAEIDTHTYVDDWADRSEMDIAPGDLPHIIYGNYSAGMLRYAAYDGAGWDIHTVTDTFYSPGLSLALDGAGDTHLAANLTGEELYYGVSGTPSGWEFSDLAEGDYPSITLDSQMRPHIAYFQTAREQLEYAVYDNGWEFDTIKEDVIIRSLALVLDQQDTPHLAYYRSNNDDLTKGQLVYSFPDNGQWQEEEIDVLSDGFYFNGVDIAVGADGNVHIVYLHSGKLKYAGIDRGSQEVIADDTQIGSFSVAAGAENLVRVAYTFAPDGFNGKKELWYMSGSYGDWKDPERVESEYARQPSISVDSEGIPHISYRCGDSGALKHAGGSPPEEEEDPQDYNLVTEGTLEDLAWEVSQIEKNNSGLSVAVNSSDEVIFLDSKCVDGEFKLVKYDSSLVVISSASYSQAGFIRARAVTADSQDNIIVAGGISPTAGDDSNFFIMKFGPDLTLTGSKEIDTPLFHAGTSPMDGAYGAAVDSGDNIIVTGIQDESIRTYKFNPNLDLLDDAVYNSDTINLGRGVAVDGDDNIFVAGTAGGDSFLTIKYNPDLIRQNVTEIDAANQTHHSGGAMAVAVSGDGDVAVTGISDDEWLIVKYDSGLTEQGRVRKENYDLSEGRGAAFDTAGNLIVSGYIETGDMYVTQWGKTVLYDTQFAVISSATFRGDGYSNKANAIAVSGDNSIYVAGMIFDDWEDSVIIKYSGVSPPDPSPSPV